LGNQLTLNATAAWSFLDENDVVPDGDFLILELDPHLRILQDRFALPDAAATASQLQLFSLPNLAGRRRQPKPVEQLASALSRKPHDADDSPVARL